MNVTENEFCLVKIEYNENIVFFEIILNADAKTKSVYFENYFQGLYIGTETQKYNIYAQIEGDTIIGQLRYESFVNFAGEKQKLWIRNRIGNTYFDNTVIIKTEETLFDWGFLDKFGFCPISLQEFYICKYENKNKNFLTNPFEKENNNFKVDNVKVQIEEKQVSFCGEINPRLLQNEEENLCNEVCLVWKNKKDNKKYYFHKEKIENAAIKYFLPFEEVNEFLKLVNGKNSFKWIMEDAYKREYELYVSEEMKLENVQLPIRSFYAKMNRLKDNTLQVDINTEILFEYISNIENGNGILLKYKKRAYALEIVDIIAQKVNTQLEYSLLFSSIRENNEEIIYEIPLIFKEHQEDFKRGIYQFWVIVKSGHRFEKVPLKLFRKKDICQNTYMILACPYALVDTYYYDCFFYNDSSNNLKCNILPKVVCGKIAEIKLLKNELELLFCWKKEPYLQTIKNIYLVSASGASIEMKLERKTELEVKARAVLDEFLQKTNEMLYFELQFENNDATLRIENNYIRPAINNREVMSFSEIREITAANYRNIWGNHTGGFYTIGISENLCLFQAADAWLEQSETLYIKLKESQNCEYKSEDCESDFKLYLKEKLTGETFLFAKELTMQDEVIYGISLHNLQLKNYLVYAEFTNGMKSYLEMQFSPRTFFSNKIEKKISLKKEQNVLQIEIEELLLCENEEKQQWCTDIIQKAREDMKNEKTNSKKIWLIGENYGLSARDNGFAFFEYCMNHIDEIDAEVYFVTKKENQDIHVLESYKDYILIYDSFEHLYYDELSEFYIVSHGIRDVMPSFYHNKIGNYHKPVIYLQHGITAMKIIGISNTSYGGSIRKFIVSSYKEGQLLADKKQFWEDELAVTGFARYDKLDLDSQKTGSYIWIMPTWRDWLVKLEENFLQTDFYKNYSLILGNAELIKLLKRKKQKIVFSLHTEFEKYKHFFEKYENEVVHITDMHEKSITDRVKECSMIVTDYSSVVFDVVYLNKPCLFFQFDQEIYVKYRGSYVDLETDLPGEVVHEAANCLAALEKIINNHFVVSDHFKEKQNNYFDFHDKENSQRIYQEIIKCRQEIENEY